MRGKLELVLFFLIPFLLQRTGTASDDCNTICNGVTSDEGYILANPLPASCPSVLPVPMPTDFPKHCYLRPNKIIRSNCNAYKAATGSVADGQNPIAIEATLLSMNALAIVPCGSACIFPFHPKAVPVCTSLSLSSAVIELAYSVNAQMSSVARNTRELANEANKTMAAEKEDRESDEAMNGMEELPADGGGENTAEAASATNGAVAGYKLAGPVLVEGAAIAAGAGIAAINSSKNAVMDAFATAKNEAAVAQATRDSLPGHVTKNPMYDPEIAKPAPARKTYAERMQKAKKRAWAGFKGNPKMRYDNLRTLYKTFQATKGIASGDKSAKRWALARVGAQHAMFCAEAGLAAALLSIRSKSIQQFIDIGNKACENITEMDRANHSSLSPRSKWFFDRIKPFTPKLSQFFRVKAAHASESLVTPASTAVAETVVRTMKSLKESFSTGKADSSGMKGLEAAVMDHPAEALEIYNSIPDFEETMRQGVETGSTEALVIGLLPDEASDVHQQYFLEIAEAAEEESEILRNILDLDGKSNSISLSSATAASPLGPKASTRNSILHPSSSLAALEGFIEDFPPLHGEEGAKKTPVLESSPIWHKNSPLSLFEIVSKRIELNARLLLNSH